VHDAAKAVSLKMNAGNWKYQGFAEFNAQSGFDTALADEHYNAVFDLELDETELVTSTEYGAAMEQVMSLLVRSFLSVAWNMIRGFWLGEVS
jgi:hypothetical protein